MAVSVAVLRARFPQTLGDPLLFDSTYLADYIGAANLRIDPVIFGECADEACLYLAAHLALIDPQGKSTGVKSAEAKDVEIEFDRSEQAEIWRKEFVRLQRMVTPVGAVMGSRC